MTMGGAGMWVFLKLFVYLFSVFRNFKQYINKELFYYRQDLLRAFCCFFKGFFGTTCYYVLSLTPVSISETTPGDAPGTTEDASD